MNDIDNEGEFVWTDGSSYSYTGGWDDGQPQKDKYNCKKKKIAGVIKHGKKKCKYRHEDGVYWSSSGWHDAKTSESHQALCANPNLEFDGESDSSSFMETIDSISCIEANRGPLKQCQDFAFTTDNFGNSNIGYTQFTCDGAQELAGFNNSAWLLAGIIFKDDSGTLDSVIGVKCCLIPGTIYNYDDQTRPQDPSHITAYGNENVQLSSNSYNSNFYGMKNIVRGSGQAVQGFTFNSISDYEPSGCNLAGASSVSDNDHCMNNRVGMVNYENVIATEEGVTPNIDVSVFECGDGCDASISNECSDEYNQDINSNDNAYNGGPNPFVEKFECSNINYTQAIMTDYKKCYPYPVYPALFYDYDVELHREMIVLQLNPYTTAMSQAMLKLWQTIFIIIIIKQFIFPIYFKLEEEIASNCCEAIRLRRVVQVEVAKELTTKQLDAMRTLHANSLSPFPMSPSMSTPITNDNNKGFGNEYKQSLRSRSTSTSFESFKLDNA